MLVGICMEYKSGKAEQQHTGDHVDLRPPAAYDGWWSCCCIAVLYACNAELVHHHLPPSVASCEVDPYLLTSGSKNSVSRGHHSYSNTPAFANTELVKGGERCGGINF